MIQSIQQILPRNLHLRFTLHNTVLERAQKILNGYLSEFLPFLLIDFGGKSSIGYYKVLF